METQELLAVQLRRAARMLGVSARTLSDMAKRGVGPRYARLPGGRAMLFPVEELRRWLDERGKATAAAELPGKGGCSGGENASCTGGVAEA